MHDTPMNGDTSPSAFMSLPGELRNRIYRLSLVTEAMIDVFNQGPYQPPLLLTCHRIRREAISIYYGENTFRIRMPFYNSDTSVKWQSWVRRTKSKHKVYPQSKCLIPHVSRNPNWPNLLMWLKRFHARTVDHRIYKPSEKPDRSADALLVGCMFQTVLDKRSKPWASVEPLIKEQHQVLIAIDQRWRDHAESTA